LFEWLKLFYLARLDEGVSLSEIDKMDIFKYLDLVEYKQEKKYWENQRRVVAMLKGF